MAVGQSIGEFELADGAVTARKLASSMICAARYVMTVNQSVPNGPFTVLNYNTKDYDTDNAVTVGAAWKFTVPAGKGGKYHMTASVNAVGCPVFTELFFVAWLNGGEAMVGSAGVGCPSGSGTARMLGLLAGDFLLNPGDTLAANLLQANAAAAALLLEATGSRIAICIHRLVGY